MDPRSVATRSSSADEHQEHLLKTAQYLGVSLNVLLDLRNDNPATLGAMISDHDPANEVSFPGGIISRCDESLLVGIQEDSSFGVLPGHNPEFSLPSCPVFQVDDASASNELSPLGEANSSVATKHHVKTNGTPWNRHSCDEDYSFIWNDLLRDNLDPFQRQPLEKADNLSQGPTAPAGFDDYDWVQITPQWSGESAESNGSSGSSSRDSSTNDERSVPSPEQPSPSKHTMNFGESISPRSSRNIQLLAPRGTNQFASGSKYVTSQSALETVNKTLVDMVQSNANRSISRRNLGRKKKKRSPYVDKRVRNETFMTRKMNACVRCRMQRNRCIPDPTNPTGPCKPCQEKLVRMTRLPCLRYKITDSTLFRTGLDYMPFYKRHPMFGPTYGDFHIDKDWVGATTRLLDITQDRGPVPLTLEVREFSPPSEENALDLKGRSMYYIPWAVADAESAVRAVNAYADASVESYLDALLDDSNHLVWEVFHAAIRLSVFPKPNKLLRNVLRLWVICRFIESRWRVCGNETLNAETLKDPFYDWISPPPFVDYQFASIVIYRVLEPLRLETLRDFQTLVLANKSSNWYQIFLVSFILLHNYELQILFQRQFAARRKARVRYLDMPLVRATHSGAKTILAHFHYGCKGQRPFREDFDWKAPQIRRMAELDTEQSVFMERYKMRVNENITSLRAINRTDEYEGKYWFVSQLFEEDWSPRDTCEHSPPA